MLQADEIETDDDHDDHDRRDKIAPKGSRSASCEAYQMRFTAMLIAWLMSPERGEGRRCV